MCEHYKISKDLQRTLDSIVGAVFAAGFFIGALLGFCLTVIIVYILNYTKIIEIKTPRMRAVTSAHEALIRGGPRFGLLRGYGTPIQVILPPRIARLQADFSSPLIRQSDQTQANASMRSIGSGIPEVSAVFSASASSQNFASIPNSYVL
jgi:hypothetical protein